jgi:hypothetical protein
MRLQTAVRQFGLVCTPAIVIAAIGGCKSTNSSTPAPATTAPRVKSDPALDVADAVEIMRLVGPEEAKLPPPVSVSTEKPKPDEAIARFEYGPPPTQKKALTLKKRDGKWAIERWVETQGGSEIHIVK